MDVGRCTTQPDLGANSRRRHEHARIRSARSRDRRLLVSNINDAPGDVDDNGCISRVSPDGRVLALKWIDGANTYITLHAPKGGGIYGDRFYVADIDVVRIFDRNSGEPLGEWAVSGASFLNDLAIGADGTVYVTDTSMDITAQGFEPTDTAAVCRFDAQGTAEAISRGDDLNLSNGVIESPPGPPQ